MASSNRNRRKRQRVNYDEAANQLDLTEMEEQISQFTGGSPGFSPIHHDSADKGGDDEEDNAHGPGEFDEENQRLAAKGGDDEQGDDEEEDGAGGGGDENENKNEDEEEEMAGADETALISAAESETLNTYKAKLNKIKEFCRYITRAMKNEENIFLEAYQTQRLFIDGVIKVVQAQVAALPNLSDTQLALIGLARVSGNPHQVLQVLGVSSRYPALLEKYERIWKTGAKKSEIMMARELRRLKGIKKGPFKAPKNKRRRLNKIESGGDESEQEEDAFGGLSAKEMKELEVLWRASKDGPKGQRLRVTFLEKSLKALKRQTGVQLSFGLACIELYVKHGTPSSGFMTCIHLLSGKDPLFGIEKKLENWRTNSAELIMCFFEACLFLYKEDEVALAALTKMIYIFVAKCRGGKYKYLWNLLVGLLQAEQPSEAVLLFEKKVGEFMNRNGNLISIETGFGSNMACPGENFSNRWCHHLGEKKKKSLDVLDVTGVHHGQCKNCEGFGHLIFECTELEEKVKNRIEMGAKLFVDSKRNNGFNNYGKGNWKNGRGGHQGGYNNYGRGRGRGRGRYNNWRGDRGNGNWNNNNYNNNNGNNNGGNGGGNGNNNNGNNNGGNDAQGGQ